ncbi:hypothetical protein BJV74DRAFT_315246 [Russula compacta]|nr:hypothetical protein BJV74DRAFT_315246 [Russula compacta]
MPRPRPRTVLLDLPLDPFLQTLSDDPNIPTPPTGSKRSRSPSLARSIFSPAKRRILEQERLFHPSQSRPYPSPSIHSLRPPRGALLHAFDGTKCLLGSSLAGLSDGLPSPSRHPHAVVPPLPRAPRRISPRLSASPRSKTLPSPTTTTPTRTSPRKTRSSQPQTTPPTSPQRVRRASTSTTTPSPPAPTMVLRELPPPPDRRSVHYPGFDVHLDTHVALPCVRSKARAKAEAAARVHPQGEAGKENVRPVATDAPSKGKVKGDVAPRRSARLRTSYGGYALLHKTVAPESRTHGRRQSTLHDSSLQF